MSGLEFDINPGNVHSKNLTKERKVNCIEYLNLFVETFNDPFMTRIFEKIHKSAFISTSQAESIEKRLANIILKSNIEKNALRYIMTYWKMLLPIKIAMNHNELRPPCSPLIKEKSESMLPFFYQFGYITMAQFKVFISIGTYSLEEIEDRLNHSKYPTSTIKEMEELYNDITSKIDKIVLSRLPAEISKRRKKTHLNGFNNWLVNNLIMINNHVKTKVKSPKSTKETRETLENKMSVPEHSLSLRAFREQFEV